jgi:hypothetical protein
VQEAVGSWLSFDPVEGSDYKNQNYMSRDMSTSMNSNAQCE